MKVKKFLLQIVYDPELTAWTGDDAAFARLMRILALSAARSATSGDLPSVFASVEESESVSAEPINHHGPKMQATGAVLRQPSR